LDVVWALGLGLGELYRDHWRCYTKHMRTTEESSENHLKKPKLSTSRRLLFIFSTPLLSSHVPGSSSF
jgi:hypothetical protein